MAWSQHHDYLVDNWEPGQHISIVAPTGRGKTYLVTKGLMPVLGSDERILIVDLKGDDPRLKGLGYAVSKFPSRLLREYHATRYGKNYRPIYRLVVPVDLSATSVLEQRRIVLRALASLFKEGEWTVIFDEIATLAENITNYGLGLAGPLNSLWRMGRSRKISIVGNTQAPRWVPRAMYDQATYLYIGRIGDKQAKIRLREIGGDADTLFQALGNLAKHEFAFTGWAGDVLQRVQVGRG